MCSETLQKSLMEHVPHQAISVTGPNHSEVAAIMRKIDVGMHDTHEVEQSPIICNMIYEESEIRKVRTPKMC